MNLDFTIHKYADLLAAFQQSGYRFLSLEQYLTLRAENKLPERFVILRHDIDKRPTQALRVAEVEQNIGAKASYYFRIVKESNNPTVIRQIADWGFEVGYHYEDMSLCNGNRENALKHFNDSLAYFRQFYPVQTICMHGAPRSHYDSRDLWQQYDYRDFGILGEPYFDVDFADVFYLTDTGRRWDGYRVSVRDKIPEYQDRWTVQGLVFHTTNDIIKAIKNDTLPRHILMTTHPQRWLSKPLLWLYELLRQTAANSVKRCLVK